MRKLKLQSANSPNGELDWMTFKMDDKILEYINSITDASDTILMGRKMTDGFVNYWTGVLENPESPEYTFARKMVDYPRLFLQNPR